MKTNPTAVNRQQQVIDENRNDETSSGNKNLTGIFNVNFTNISNLCGENLSDCHAFEEYMNCANVSESYRFSTISLESLETIVCSLKKFVA